LLIGITRLGIIQVLERIGFPYIFRHPSHKTNHANIYSDLHGSYQRPTSLSWVTDSFGEFKSEWKHGRFVSTTGTGYDVAECVRAWLSKTGNVGLSICEVLTAEGSCHVGQAKAFFSHVQSMHISQALHSLLVAAEAFAQFTEQTCFWFDLFTLRQCQKGAFVPSQIVSVIGRIGLTLVELDEKATYLTRSFCLFEVFATIQGKAELLCLARNTLGSDNISERWEEMLELPEMIQTLDSTTADCRSKEDQKLVVEYIQNAMGSEHLDDELKKAIMRGADRCRPGVFSIPRNDTKLPQRTYIQLSFSNAEAEWDIAMERLCGKTETGSCTPKTKRW